MKYAILTDDWQGNIIAIAVPPSYDWHQTQDLRDVLEMTFGYDTRGIAELTTLAEAKKRSKASQGSEQ